MNFGQAVYFADGLGVEHAALVFAVLDADTVDLLYLPKANDPRLFSADFGMAVRREFGVKRYSGSGAAQNVFSESAGAFPDPAPVPVAPAPQPLVEVKPAPPPEPAKGPKSLVDVISSLPQTVPAPAQPSVDVPAADFEASH